MKTIYRRLTGSKTPNSRSRRNKEFVVADQLPVKARLVQLTISGG